MNEFNDLKDNLEEIFEILYEANKLELAGMIQRMYFLIDEQLDDHDYEYYSTTESEDDDDIYVSSEELEIQVDENGFHSLS
tara:strand:+ start:138 stop:380 length:243 start_codon:yes stop_codon:yes gene_type:complete